MKGGLTRSIFFFFLSNLQDDRTSNHPYPDAWMSSGLHWQDKWRPDSTIDMVDIEHM